jgi:hypothetical protein
MGGTLGKVGNIFKGSLGGFKSITGTGKRRTDQVVLDKTPFERDLRFKGDQFFEGQRQAKQLKRLDDAAKGKTPSLAEAQLKQAQDRSLKQQLASAASGRGGNQAALQRALLSSQARQSAETNQQAAQAKLQEQQQTEQLLASTTLQKRNQDINLQQADKNARMQAALNQANLDLGVGNANLAAAQSADANRGAMIGGAMSSAGAAMASDKKEKKNVKSSKKDVNNFLEALSAKSYEYKDTSKPGTAEGKRYGIMAQDLEKSSMGKALVKEVNGTKMVNTSQGFGSVLAAQSEMHKRLKELESKQSNNKKSEIKKN